MRCHEAGPPKLVTRPNEATSLPHATVETMLSTFPLRLGQVVAIGRVALGISAIAAPTALARPWIGQAASDDGARLLAREMGGRDLALGLGAMRSLSNGRMSDARTWMGMGGLADCVDAAVTVLAFRRLPRLSRWGILASTAGAAVVSMRVAQALAQDPGRDVPWPPAPMAVTTVGTTDAPVITFAPRDVEPSTSSTDE